MLKLAQVLGQLGVFLTVHTVVPLAVMVRPGAQRDGRESRALLRRRHRGARAPHARRAPIAMRGTVSTAHGYAPRGRPVIPQ